MKEIDIILGLSKRGLRWIKRNLSVVIILPAVLGGLWQLIELSSISFSFIRFFSASQVIPDGLLILLILVLFTISASFLYLIYYYTINLHGSQTLKNVDEEKEDKLTPRKSNLFISTALIISYVAVLVGYIYAMSYFLDKLDSLLTLLILFPIGMILIYIAMVFYIYGNLHCINTNFLSRIFRSSIWLMPMVIFISTLMFATQFHKMFLMPSDLINVEIVRKKIAEENPSVNIEIIYTNDKYIFVELDGFMQLNNKPIRKLIRVIRFEDLLEINDNKGYALPKGF